MSAESCGNCQPRDEETLCFVRENVYAHEFQWLEEDNVTPIDITGYSAKLQVREKADSQIVIVEVNDGAGLLLTGPLGKIDLTFTSVQTGLMVNDVYAWDLRLTSPSNVVDTIVGGSILPEQAVTRGA